MSASLKLTINKQFGLLWFNYLMYLLIVPAVIGLFVSFFKSSAGMSEHAVHDRLVESHYQWLIRTFVIILVMSMASIGTIYMGVGYFLAIATIGYWFIRVFHGMYNLAMNQPMPGLE